MKKPKIVLAFSGGLDTTFCALWLQKELGAEVVTATVDTGGFSRPELAVIAASSKALGAVKHYTLDGRAEVFARFAVPLIQGNVLRGRAYPLSVAAERVLQAELVARVAKEVSADGVCHGSTGAGNDQVRFDAVFSVLLPGVKVHTPIRDLGLSRRQETDYLAKEGVAVPAKTTAYSVNAGLWGTTVGGGATHDPWAEIPDSAFPSASVKAPAESRDVVVGFEKGVPVSLDGKKLAGVALVAALHALGREYAVGRGVHMGDTILGIKGRIAFEAPAPLMLIAAHNELEKLVLTRWQSFWKNQLGEFYGQMLHEGLYFDPVMRDIEAMIESSQQTVTGAARLRLRAGRFDVTGVKSPFSMVAGAATYGETTKLWTGGEAAGFSKLHALPMTLAARARAEKVAI
ncbi:MAG: argininosuccinate synthase [Elusimicrobia bacterium RIFOXYD12_FULL_66_9]|nr:MAG: argininosuccinate synthase [Elusimicrobia bacterium RIFOXYD12_FULL_66_9]